MLEVNAKGIKRKNAKTPNDTKVLYAKSFINEEKFISFSKNKKAKK